MAYTFGANINDRIVYANLPLSLFATNRISLVCCWVRPTTLTANRALWASAAASGLVVGGTTSDVVLVSDCATTDWNCTFPAGLAVNTWSFVAILLNQGASTVKAARGWVGKEATPPIEVTGTHTSTPVGAWVDSGTGFTIGNAPAGGAAFQGDIGGMVVLSDSPSSGSSTIAGVPADGALTQVRADQVLNSLVTPLWKGDLGVVAGMGRQVHTTVWFGFSLSASLDNSVAGGAWAVRGSAVPNLGTITSATASALRTPRSIDDHQLNKFSTRRRTGYLVKP